MGKRIFTEKKKKKKNIYKKVEYLQTVGTAAAPESCHVVSRYQTHIKCPRACHKSWWDRRGRDKQEGDMTFPKSHCRVVAELLSALDLNCCKPRTAWLSGGQGARGQFTYKRFGGKPTKMWFWAPLAPGWSVGTCFSPVGIRLSVPPGQK